MWRWRRGVVVGGAEALSVSEVVEEQGKGRGAGGGGGGAR
jgi:hypothetical protein